MTEKRTLTVSALNRYLKLKLDQDPHLGSILIKGEISNFNHHRSGHMYYSLKDDQSKIKAVMFRGNNRQLAFKPEDGMQVIVEGHVSIYEAYGEYQIYVKQMQPDGIGSLYLAYEQLKEKLQLEGIFKEEHKKPIPKYPEHIGIITSPTGAAVRDMITTINRRNPHVKITVIPALVQGREAVPSIIKQLNFANDQQLCDVLLVGRGGGSIEDLWAFNDEKVVRAIFASEIPVIAGIGHETDTTISDFVADMRASTPTGAAELAVKEKKQLEHIIHTSAKSINHYMQHRLLKVRKQLQTYMQSRPFQEPKNVFDKHRQTIDYMEMSMDRHIQHLLSRKKHAIEQYHIVKQQGMIRMKLANQRAKTNHLHGKTIDLYKQQIKRYENRLHMNMEKLILLNPLTILHRGFSLPLTKEGQVIRSIQEVEEDQEINLRLHDGIVETRATQVRKEQIDD